MQVHTWQTSAVCACTHLHVLYFASARHTHTIRSSSSSRSDTYVTPYFHIAHFKCVSQCIIRWHRFCASRKNWGCVFAVCVWTCTWACLCVGFICWAHSSSVHANEILILPLPRVPCAATHTNTCSVHHHTQYTHTTCDACVAEVHEYVGDGWCGSAH